MELKSRVLDIPANIVVLHVTGKIVTKDLKALEDEFERLIQGPPVKLVLDLKGVDAIDSQGVGALIRLRFEIVNRGGNIVLIGVTDRVLTILRISGLHEYFAMAPSEFKAIKILEG
jgi:anti-sigma B factor antagonist